MPKHEYFDVDVGERIATVTINRPEARNALTAAMRRDFGALMPALGEDDAVDVVVLTGVDPAFCSGVDLKDRLADGTVPPRVEPNPAAVLRSMPIPVIAPRLPTRKPNGIAIIDIISTNSGTLNLRNRRTSSLTVPSKPLWRSS